MERPASRAAALIAATTRPASAGGSPPACQPVPIRAVRRIAASVEPPIHIGRSGCTGSRGPADPHRQIGLHGFWRDGDVLQLVEGAAEVDRLLSPQAADDIEAF